MPCWLYFPKMVFYSLGLSQCWIVLSKNYTYFIEEVPKKNVYIFYLVMPLWAEFPQNGFLVWVYPNVALTP